MTDRTFPFLRWAGGKRWIAPVLAPILNRVLQHRYIEPFLGSGAVFFALHPRRAILSDLNEELIEVYTQVKLHSSVLEKRLASIPVNKATYYRLRAEVPQSRLERTLRFIYLNRTCFGGLHRTNRHGEFNVPYGGGSRTPEPICRDHLLMHAARVLRNPGVALIAGDFNPVMGIAGEGDVIFCDPTYQSAGRGRFDRYGPTVFSWADQNRLSSACQSACRRGAVVIVMNADHADVLPLYKGATLLCTVSRRKTIGNRPFDERRHREIIAVLDPLERHELWAELRSAIAKYVFQPASAVAGAA